MKKIISIGIQIIFILSLHQGLGAQSEKSVFTFSPGIEKMFGYTQYQIGGFVSIPDGPSGMVQDPLSELKFPLDTWLLTGTFSAQINPKHSLQLNAKTTLSQSNSGKMEDSDWGVHYLESNGDPTFSDSSLDIFSKSDAKLKAVILEPSWLYHANEKDSFFLGIGIGFLYQKFNFDVSDLDQWYPSYPQYAGLIDPGYAYHDYQAGLVLTYEIEYFIPYLQILSSIELEKDLQLTGILKLSPYTMARDEDHHLLRNKEVRSQTTGIALIVDLEFKKILQQNLALIIAGSYTYIDTNGEQKQYTSGTHDVTIDSKIESQQLTLGLKLDLAF